MGRTRISFTVLVLLGLLAWPAAAVAQEGDRSSDEGARHPVARERILRAFDKDGDGRLNEAERDAVREQLGERFEVVRKQVRILFNERDADDEEDEGDDDESDVQGDDDNEDSDDDGDDGDEDEDDDADRRERRGRGRGGPEVNRDRDAQRDRPGRGGRGEAEGDRGPEADRREVRRRAPEGDRPGRDAERPREATEGRGRERSERPPVPPVGVRPFGPGGPMGPGAGRLNRDFESLFGWFDMDGDNMLSRGEFSELAQFVQRRSARGPGGPPVGPGFGRPGIRGGRPADREDSDAGPADRIRRFEGPPRGERLDRGDADDRSRDGGHRPPRPPRPDGPPEAGPDPEGPNLAPRDA